MFRSENKKALFQVATILEILKEKGEKGASIEEIDLLIPFKETVSRRTLQRRLEEMQPELIFSAGAARATRYFNNKVNRTGIENINTGTDRETTNPLKISSKKSPDPAGNNYEVPALQNGWTNYGGENAAVGYCKNKNGIVYLRGSIKDGLASAGTTLFILPDGYRPSGGRLMFPAIGNNGFARVDIRANGEVIIMTDHTSFLSLDAIHFLAD
jgi:hypothetical protein